MTFRKIGCIFLAALALVGCGKTEEKPAPDKVAVQLKWVHQAQFAGFYVAKERGFYADENLEVTFLEGGGGIDIAQSVVSGNALFGVMAPEDLLIKRAQGEPLKALAAIYRRSAVVYVSNRSFRLEGHV
ncbi:MAG: ABC transporter substrate-binding protein [Desulfatibacillum sp.]|nr:ABC transporter substrate-binding protein [Desulfatibacillum sp.]